VIVAITDTAISPIGQMADTVLVASPTGTGLQNSMVAPMAVANALLNGVMTTKGAAALDRYNACDRLLDEWNSFELKSNQASKRADNWAIQSATDGKCSHA
jgi:DNA-binding MurR/RpiR family transcriptional regulator